MGFQEGDLVLEIGHDDDCDQSLRDAITEVTKTALIEEETSEVVDAVLLWWREGDGDLVDDLVDALTYLSESGPLWLLTPKLGRDGHVDPSDIKDAIPNVGLSQTSTISIAADWSATRCVARKSVKR
jgi:hypothetical protein